MNDLLNKHHIVIPAQRSGHYIEVAAQRSGNINPAKREVKIPALANTGSEGVDIFEVLFDSQLVN